MTSEDNCDCYLCKIPVPVPPVCTANWNLNSWHKYVQNIINNRVNGLQDNGFKK